MSRFSGDDYDPNFPNEGELFWANAMRSIGGKPGRALLRILRDELLSMPEKKLISGRLADEEGHVCAVGALNVACRVKKGEKREDVLADLARRIAPEDDYEATDVTALAGVQVGAKYGFAYALGDLNDETFYRRTPEERYEGVLAWIDQKLAT